MEEDIKEVTEEQKKLIYNQVNELKYSNAALLAENEMFERFICRIDPQNPVSQAGGEGVGAAGASEPVNCACYKKGNSQSNASTCPHHLTVEQKLHVAKREITEIRHDWGKLKKRFERVQDNDKASLKEAEIRLAEIRKAQNELERRLLTPMKENKLKMKEPERVLQYVEDKSKPEKLYTKNQALKAHEKKLQQQLLQRRETGRAEYADIFLEYSEHSMEKNLDELQVNNLKGQRVLSSHKEKLQSVTLESAELSRDISNRKQMLAGIEAEIQHVEEERLKAKAYSKHLRHQIADYQAPSITDYMHVKDRHKKLQQSVHTWHKKVGITQQMVLKTQSKAKNYQRGGVSPVYSAEVGVKTRELPVKLPCIAEHST